MARLSTLKPPVAKQTPLIATMRDTRDTHQPARTSRSKIPHRGNEQLFWDIGNPQAVIKAWHNSEAQSEERKA